MQIAYINLPGGEPSMVGCKSLEDERGLLPYLLSTLVLSFFRPHHVVTRALPQPFTLNSTFHQFRAMKTPLITCSPCRGLLETSAACYRSNCSTIWKTDRSASNPFHAVSLADKSRSHFEGS